MNKRRIWATSPVYYVMAAVMFIMACFSYTQNKILFAVEITVSGLCLAAVIMTDLHYRVHVYTALRAARKVLSADEQRNLGQFALPLAVLGSAGDIVWTNERFQDLFTENGEGCGDNIAAYIYPKTLRQILSENGTSVSYGDREFTAYGLRTESGSVLYFVDDTYYKQIQRDYREKRTVIAVISFDNREELTRDASGSEDSRITSEVESVLRSWAIDTMEGFLRRMTNGRYMLITDDQHIEEAKTKRFAVLDSVRAVKGENNMSATISIGIGRAGVTATESELHARQALEMALGRGGDQVALRQKNGYEFFGGTGRGVEKRNKVRARIMANAITEVATTCDNILIMGHRFADLDCLGAAIGMYAGLSTLGKPCSIVLDTEKSLAQPLYRHMLQQDKRYEDAFVSPAQGLDMVGRNTLLVVVDTHIPSILESREIYEACRNVIVIDHHRKMVEHIDNAIIFFHEPYASSASEMVAELVQYFKEGKLRISVAEAEALLAGIMLDTKSFILRTGVRTFEAAAFLRRMGADTVAVRKLFASSMESYQERSRLVSAAEVYRGCAISCTSGANVEGIRVVAPQAADDLLGISGVDASFVLYEQDSAVNISARSMGAINVQLILEGMGGGGHQTMAAAQLKHITPEAARARIEGAIDKYYASQKKGDVEGK